MACRSRPIYHQGVFLKFIEPCAPMLAKTVPAGDDWQHEIKFDGFRVQPHINGKTVELFSRNGYKFSRRYLQLVAMLGELPTMSAIIDGEIVASNARGCPTSGSSSASRRSAPRSTCGRSICWRSMARYPEVVAGTSPVAPAGPAEPVRLPSTPRLRKLR